MDTAFSIALAALLFGLTFQLTQFVCWILGWWLGCGRQVNAAVCAVLAVIASVAAIGKWDGRQRYIERRADLVKQQGDHPVNTEKLRDTRHKFYQKYPIAQAQTR